MLDFPPHQFELETSYSLEADGNIATGTFARLSIGNSEITFYFEEYYSDHLHLLQWPRHEPEHVDFEEIFLAWLTPARRRFQSVAATQLTACYQMLEETNLDLSNLWLTLKLEAPIIYSSQRGFRLNNLHINFANSLVEQEFNWLFEGRVLRTAFSEKTFTSEVKRAEERKKLKLLFTFEQNFVQPLFEAFNSNPGLDKI
jgi:hypothetical protein